MTVPRYFVEVLTGKAMLQPSDTGSLVRFADVADSLRRACRDCRHYDGDDVKFYGYGFCTNALSWFAHKAMPPDEGCTKFEAKEGE